LIKNPTSGWLVFKSAYQLDGCTQNLHMSYLHTHYVKFQAPTLESIVLLLVYRLFYELCCLVLLLVYKLFYELCCLFFWQSLELSFFVVDILFRANFFGCAIHIIGTYFCPWCCRFWVFFFLICHVFFGALWLWHHALFFVIRLHRSNICTCCGVLILLHLVGNYICLHQLVHFPYVCKCWCFIWILLYILFISWPFLF